MYPGRAGICPAAVQGARRVRAAIRSVLTAPSSMTAKPWALATPRPPAREPGPTTWSSSRPIAAMLSQLHRVGHRCPTHGRPVRPAAIRPGVPGADRAGQGRAHGTPWPGHQAAFTRLRRQARRRRATWPTWPVRSSMTAATAQTADNQAPARHGQGRLGRCRRPLILTVRRPSCPIPAVLERPGPVVLAHAGHARGLWLPGPDGPAAPEPRPPGSLPPAGVQGPAPPQAGEQAEGGGEHRGQAVHARQVPPQGAGQRGTGRPMGSAPQRAGRKLDRPPARSCQ